MIVQNLIVKFQNFFKIDINPDRIFGLDLLRACAILFVVVGHSGNLIEWERFKYVDFFILDGVSIFFVLSGFLIGKILIEAITKNEISLKLIMNFWLKRWFRTMPNYFLILTVIVGLNIVYNSNFEIEDVYHYYFFSQNLWTIQPDFFPESWSLSIEEWFYILTPILLYLVIKGIRLSTKQAIIAVAILVIIFETFFRLYRFMNVDITNNEFLYSLLRSQVLTRFDSLMYGVIGSWLNVYYAKYWYKHKNIQLVIGLILFLIIKIEMVLFETFGLYDCVFSFSLTAVATLLILPYLSSLKKGIGSISKYITVISLISYSMYLINYTLVLEWIIVKINWTKFQNFNPYLSLICKISSFFMITILLSILIYKYFETPFMKLRDKMVVDASLNTLSNKKQNSDCN